MFLHIKFAYVYFINFDSYCKFDISLDFYSRLFIASI